MRPFLAFAAAAFVLEQLPAVLGRSGTWLDLVTPFGVLGAAAWAFRDRRGLVAGLAVCAAVLYVDGHGIHLSANDIGHFRTISGRAEGAREFWDERFGHLEWHAGFLALLAAFSAADTRRSRPTRSGWAAAILLGWTLFTTTVEGQDWWLTLAAAAVFVPWALARRRRTLEAVATAAALGSALIGAWAIWHGGVPQFSQIGWL